ncbi:cytochrome P450 [Cladochytrium replicatum]|nr:cytochrome P450 [Cladochytrium replicatum]
MASLDYVGLTTLAAVFLTSLSVIVLLRPRRPLTDPPVPTVPFYKSAYFTMMMPYIPMDERFRRTLSHLSKDGTKIFQEWFGPVPVVTLTTAESAKVMFDYAKFPKLSLMRSLAVGESIASYLFGTNIVTAGGEEYLLHRSITRPAFARPYRLPVFVNCTRKLLTILRTHAQHHRDIPIDTYPFMQRLTLDVLGAAILSVDFGSLPESSSIPKDITNAHELKPGHFVDVWNALVANVFRPAYFFVPYYSKLPLPSVKRDWKVAKEFRGMMETIVEERIQQRRAANADGDYQNKKDMDLVDMMVEAGEAIIRDGSDRHPDKPQWTQEKMVHNLNMFFLAHDTTANALSAAFYLIAKHPGAQVKLRDEVAGIFGKPNSVSDALFEADENAVRCKSSVSAVTSMRSSKRRCGGTKKRPERCKLAHLALISLYPSVPFPAVRVAEEDTVLRVPFSDGSVKSITLKKGACVRTNVYLLHRDEDLYSDPDDFKPERWLSKKEESSDDDTSNAKASGWYPFAGGTRICMGLQMSLIEQRIVIAMIVRSFQIKLSEQAEKEGYVLAGSNLMRPVGLKLFFHPLV